MPSSDVSEDSDSVLKCIKQINTSLPIVLSVIANHLAINHGAEYYATSRIIGSDFCSFLTLTSNVLHVFRVQLS